MKPEYLQQLNSIKKKKKQVKKKITQLRKLRKGEVDNLIHPLHDSAFNHIDCLECANCCKTTGPLFTSRDIERVSSHLNLKPAGFILQYLRIDGITIMY